MNLGFEVSLDCRKLGLVLNISLVGWVWGLCIFNGYGASWWTYNDPLRAKYNAKMAGMNAAIAKPKGSKKLKDWESR
ncbi:unnamed protein product [Thlaspi arvense]|uniref:Uncharacterized protein n=1 Tax=Thlaspi arvense TaxID=13288 RepID=A0AAU9S8A2_THLAR|nr:unnamed protein product [Thlaspi arvense]